MLRLSRLALPLLAAGWLLLYWWQPLLRGTTLYSGYTATSDLIDGFLPLFTLLQEALQRGPFPPLWNPYSLNGVPLLAEGQVGLFYPFHWLAWLPLDPLAAINLLLALDMLLAAGFTWLLARRLGLSQAGALLAGLTFGGCGFICCHLQHVNLVHAAVWLPAILWALRRLADAAAGRPRRAAALLLAMTIAMQHLAGHPQITYITWLGTAAYLAARAWRHRAGLPAQLGLPLAALLLGTALAAVQLLPTAEYTSLSNRAGGLDFAAAGHTSFPLQGLILLLFPFYFGDPSRATYLVNEEAYGFFQENGVYVGLLPLLLALLALAGGRWRRYPLLTFLCAWSGCALVLALGTNSPWYGWARHVLPGLTYFRYPARFLIWPELTLALLAGAGLDWLLLLAGRAEWPNWPRLRPWCAGMVCLTAALDLHGLFAAVNSMDSPRAGWLQRPALQTTLAKEWEPFRIYSPDAIAAHKLAYDVGRGWKDRTAALQQLQQDLHVNTNVLYRLGSPDALLYTLRLPEARQLLAWLQPQFPRPSLPLPLPPAPGLAEVLGACNVKYLVTYRPLTHPDWEAAGQVPMDGVISPVRLYRNRKVLPRFFLVPGAALMPHNVPLTAVFATRFRELRHTVLLERTEPGSIDLGGSTLDVEEWGAERWRAVVKLKSPGFLVQLETFYPGWQATVDGSPAPVLRANGLFRAIRLPAGRHSVEMRYNPASYRWGSAISLAALVLLLGLAGRLAWTYRR